MYAPVVVLLSAPVIDNSQLFALNPRCLHQDVPRITPSLKLMAILHSSQYKASILFPRNQSYIEVPKLDERLADAMIVGQELLLDFTFLQAIHIDVNTICRSSC